MLYRRLCLFVLALPLAACVGDLSEPQRGDETEPSETPSPEGNRPDIEPVVFALDDQRGDDTLVGLRADLVFGERKPSRLRLEFPDGNSFIAKRNKLEIGEIAETWIGHLDNQPLKPVHFSRVGDTVVGTMREGNRYVRITGSASTGEAHVESIEAPEGIEGAEPPVVADDPSFVPLSLSAAEDIGEEAIDVLFVYTTATREIFGSRAAFEAAMANEVALLNQIMADGNAATRFRSAGVAYTSYTQDPEDMGTDLSRLRTNGDGFMDAIFTLRESRGADLVHLVLAKASDACGVAYYNHTGNPDLGFGVSSVSCFNKFTLQHELGHNLGFNHSNEDGGGNGGGAYDYSYGYKDATNRFRTLMAYGCTGVTCPRIPRLSNPNQTHEGHVLGTADTDNARTTRLTWKRLASITDPVLRATIRATADEADDTFCTGKPVHLAADQFSGATYAWQVNGVEVSTDPVYYFDADIAGPYEVKLVVSEGDTTRSKTTSIEVAESATLDTQDQGVCRGDGVTLTATGADEVTWTPDYDVADTGEGTTTAFPNETTTFTAEMVTEDGCTSIDSVIVQVGDRPDVPVIEGPQGARPGKRMTYSVNTPYNVIWNVTGGEILSDSGHTVEVLWTENGQHAISASAYEVEGCQSDGSLPVEVAQYEVTGGCSAAGEHGDAWWIALPLLLLFRRRYSV
jgi:hypothetical protein